MTPILLRPVPSFVVVVVVLFVLLLPHRTVKMSYVNSNYFLQVTSPYRISLMFSHSRTLLMPSTWKVNTSGRCWSIPLLDTTPQDSFFKWQVRQIDLAIWTLQQNRILSDVALQAYVSDYTWT